jgi:hypothetical protein
VVDLSRFRVGASAHDALHQDVVRDIEEEKAVGLDARVRESLRLCRSPREAVEEPAPFLAIAFLQAFLYL